MRKKYFEIKQNKKPIIVDNVFEDDEFDCNLIKRIERNSSHKNKPEYFEDVWFEERDNE